jgi:hypothetical protein
LVQGTGRDAIVGTFGVKLRDCGPFPVGAPERASEAQIAAAQADFESGPFTEQEKLGFRCAERLHQSAQKLDDTFFAQLKSVYTDPQIVELVATAAAFELFPRLVDGLRIPMTPIPESVAGKQD